MEEAKENKEDLMKIIQDLQKEIKNLKKKPRAAKIKKEKSTQKTTKELIKDRQARFTGNKFYDDGTECVTDKKFDQKYGKKFSVSPRARPEAKEYDVKCSRCGKVSKSYISESYFICPKCVKS